MANKGFNGTTVTFPTTSATIGSLRGVSYTESADEVNITGSADTVQTHVTGIPKKELTFDLVGGSTITSGSTGKLVVAWFDGKTTTFNKVKIVSKDVKGNMNGEITSTIKVTNTTTA